MNKLYAVRMIEDQAPVGFFWTDSLRDLAYMVDSVTEPDLCEFHEISGKTAIVWEDQCKWRMGEINEVMERALIQKNREHPHNSEVRSGLDFDGSLRNAATGTQLHHYVSGMDKVEGWTPIEGAVEEEDAMRH